MSEQLRPPYARPEPSIRRAELEPGRIAYSIDDDVVVAAVHGSRIQLLDADGVAEEFACASPEVAEREAMDYALLFQRPLLTEKETP